ncbi:hypothetical protein ZIOFF_055231 [Zingiber officinale]|uniref:Uncharacterized protein n=1 Tax=Zingiber officinale TaxID=94328 RepID=A0A8J5FLS9_ZINOF|nr:hypothetical protein ZIOFF_055231 [Zingiber officinale]
MEDVMKGPYKVPSFGSWNFYEEKHVDGFVQAQFFVEDGEELFEVLRSYKHLPQVKEFAKGFLGRVSVPQLHGMSDRVVLLLLLSLGVYYLAVRWLPRGVSIGEGLAWPTTKAAQVASSSTGRAHLLVVAAVCPEKKEEEEWRDGSKSGDARRRRRGEAVVADDGVGEQHEMKRKKTFFGGSYKKRTQPLCWVAAETHDTLVSAAEKPEHPSSPPKTNSGLFNASNPQHVQ